MEGLEFKILAKRQDLRDLLVLELSQSVIYLPKVTLLRSQINLCDYVLDQLTLPKQMSLLG